MIGSPAEISKCSLTEILSKNISKSRQNHERGEAPLNQRLDSCYFLYNVVVCFASCFKWCKYVTIASHTELDPSR